MNHRIVSTLVTILTTLFVAAVVLFAGAAVSVAPGIGAVPAPNNPHPASQHTEACIECHNIDLVSIPVTHRLFNVATCESCHSPSVRVQVPHSVAMGDSRCPLCHGEPARDFGIPVSHLRFETRECLLCHPGDPAMSGKEPPPAGMSKSPANSIPHPLDGTFKDCSKCHHVLPASTLPENHRDFAADTCRDCHESAGPDATGGE
ncbi:MAG: hypothetical protein FD171_412 [Actinobacteria bacterium]|nr:MAG: hypothetical protein FD171_412 [Actinomycetota bacterium]MDO8950213.1 hypothetical protein [Actinomycetota bacterium]